MRANGKRLISIFYLSIVVYFPSLVNLITPSVTHICKTILTVTDETLFASMKITIYSKQYLNICTAIPKFCSAKCVVKKITEKFSGECCCAFFRFESNFSQKSRSVKGSQIDLERFTALSCYPSCRFAIANFVSWN